MAYAYQHNKKRALDEYRDNYGEPVDKGSYPWCDILDIKFEAGEIDKLEQREKEINEYGERVC